MTNNEPGSIRVCAVVPVYRHVEFIEQVVNRLREQKLHCVLVNDGNNESDSTKLHALFTDADDVTIVDQYPNQGKGAAAYTGFKAAHSAGYTHALQVDADGQHTIEDFPKLLEISQSCPESLVTGIPSYDETVPKARLYGRYLTHFWVWVETLSFEIRDSMCGFRIYPLKATLNQLDRHLAPRMDFDTHIMVRLFWSGVRVESVPTRVTYPEDGVSNFRMWRDNVRMTALHIRLVCGMLVRSPLLLARKR